MSVDLATRRSRRSWESGISGSVTLRGGRARAPGQLLDTAGGEPALCVDRRHAARARGRHRLAVDRVHGVAACEDPVDGGARPARLDLDVADGIELELPPK